MKADPTICGVKFSGAVGRYVESVGATEVDGHGGRRVNDERGRRRPDGGGNGADVDVEAFAIYVGLDEAHAGIGFESVLADSGLAKRGAGSVVGDGRVAD